MRQAVLIFIATFAVDQSKVFGVAFKIQSGIHEGKDAVTPSAPIIVVIVSESGRFSRAVASDAFIPTVLRNFVLIHTPPYEVRIFGDIEFVQVDRGGRRDIVVIVAHEHASQNVFRESVDTVSHAVQRCLFGDCAGRSDEDIAIFASDHIAVVLYVVGGDVGGEHGIPERQEGRFDRSIVGHHLETACASDHSTKDIGQIVSVFGQFFGILLRDHDFIGSNAVRCKTDRFFLGESGDFVKNIITLHSNTAEGKAVVALSTHKVMSQVSIGLGGVYELDELVDMIDLLVQKSQAAAGETPALADEAAAGMSIGEILAQVMQAISIAQDGVTVQASDLVDTLITALMGGANAQISGAVKDVFGSDVLTISLQPVQYGQCTTKSIADIQTSIRTNSNSYGDEESRDLIGEITSIGLEGKKIAQNTTDFSSYLQKVENTQGIYKFTGKNLKGEEVTTSGYIYDVKGYDPAQIGKQTVTFRIAIANDFVGAWSTIKKFANLDIEIDPMIPLYGILTYTTEIEVVDASEVSAKATFMQGFENDMFTFKNGRDISNSNDAVFNFMIEGEAYALVIVWKEGKLVVQDAYGMGMVFDKFTDINITLTPKSDFFPLPSVTIDKGLQADPTSTVVGQGTAWKEYWYTSGTIQFEMKYDGKKVVFDGMTNNTAKYVVK